MEQVSCAVLVVVSDGYAVAVGPRGAVVLEDCLTEGASRAAEEGPVLGAGKERNRDLERRVSGRLSLC